MNNQQSNSRPKNYINGVLLCVLLIFIAPKLYQVHRNAHVSYQTGANIEWIQPSALNKTFPQPISNQDWHFNFINIERLLWNSKTDESGELLINSDTLELLESATRLIPETYTTTESKRLRFLIEKSLPDERGKSLSSLFRQYQDYHYDYRVSQNEINKAAIHQQLELLEENQRQLVLRQVKYFGSDIAKKLFQEKNLSTHYLNQRRIVSVTKSLTKAQKAARLKTLKEAYKAALKADTE